MWSTSEKELSKCIIHFVASVFYSLFLYIYIYVFYMEAL